ncbi:hypothetical protein X793_00380 [Dehalococcoides mccartyi CG4]|uniref:AAA family ATPase n=1 Tax=Dehalococcoides mccartyi TaxID=61435 RepID=UPI0004E09B38
MLISFSVTNWKSFKNKQTLYALAGKQRLRFQNLLHIKKYGIRVLPIIAIYGGNASGKSNLIEALKFAKELIVKGTRKGEDIGVEPFAFCDVCKEQPSKFVFELLIEDVIYEYSFTVNKVRVLEEKLVVVNSKSEDVLFERNNESKNEFVIENKKIKESIKYVIPGTRENQLFLTNCVDQKNESFLKIFNWFENDLIIVSPDSRYDGMEEYIDTEEPLHATLMQSLRAKDTGIVDFEAEAVKGTEFGLEITDDDDKNLVEVFFKQRFVAAKLGSQKIYKVLKCIHKSDDGKNVKFSIAEESDGTQRLIDLLPLFETLKYDNQCKKSSNLIYCVDELDRSMHHKLTWNLIKEYLNSCDQDSRTQIIFTTHDLLLMDQKLLRRDEIYLTERTQSGESKLIPLAEYKGLRADKDLLRSYLNGRFGGVPRL